MPGNYKLFGPIYTAPQHRTSTQRVTEDGQLVELGFCSYCRCWGVVLIADAPCLTFYDPKRPTTVSADASSYDIGGVLL